MTSRDTPTTQHAAAPQRDAALPVPAAELPAVETDRTDLEQAGHIHTTFNGSAGTPAAVQSILDRLDGADYSAVSTTGLHALLSTAKCTIIVESLLNRLSPDELVAASVGGLWTILSSPKGADVVASVLDRLDGAKFSTAAYSGLWRMLSTDEGQSRMQRWLQRLDSHIGMPSASYSAGSFWALHATCTDQDNVEQWLERLNTTESTTASDDGLENDTS